MLTIKRRVIDRIRLFRAYDNSIAGSNAFLSAYSAAENLVGAFVLEKLSSKHCTSYIRKFGTGVNQSSIAFKFFPVAGGKTGIAIDFTPSKLGQGEWESLRHMVAAIFDEEPLAVLGQLKVSKLEIAFDVKASFDEMVCIAPGLAIENLNYLDKGTRYLGQIGGKRTYCIYDKRKQLAEKVAVDLGEDRARIEVRLRHLGKLLKDFSGVSDPFGRLVAIRRPALAKLCKSYPDDLILKNFALNVAKGVSGHCVYSSLSKHHKKQLIDRLRESAVKLNGDAGAWEKWIEPRLEAIRTNFTGASHPCN